MRAGQPAFGGGVRRHSHLSRGGTSFSVCIGQHKFHSRHAAPSSVDKQTISRVTARVRDWLASAPPTDALLANLPALELGLAESINNRNTDWFNLVCANARRLNSELDLAALASIELAALLRLHLELIQLDAGDAFRDAADRIIQQALARFDQTNGCWHSDADLSAPIVLADANAALAETFFVAWRLFRDESLRPLAVMGLVAVSEAFVPDTGLCQRWNPTDATRAEPNNLGTYVAAVQMFLTASETTARGTYSGRAQIVADFALEQFERKFSRAEPAQRVAFAEALIRLAQFYDNASYANSAAELLGPLPDQRHGIDAAAYALALEHLHHFPLTIVIVGDTDDDERAMDLWLASLQHYASARAIRVLHPQRHRAQIQALGLTTEDEGARAYVRRGEQPLPPVRSAAELQRVLKQARTR